MELDKEVHIKQVLKRFPPGDRWTPVGAEEPVFSSLTEVFDIGAAYDTSNGRFTPNVAGIYWVKTCIIWSTTSSSTNNAHYTVNVRKNGTTQIRDIIHIDKQDWWSSECSGLVQLNGSSDYIDVTVWHNRGGDESIEGDNVNKTHFQAYWVRALT